MSVNPLASDLDHVLAHTASLWEDLRGRRLFLTGGTGFFGCWLLESFAWANDALGLGAEALVLTRDRAAFAAKCPHLAAHPAIRFHEGDIRSFPFPDGAFSHVIHGATEAKASLNRDDPLAMIETITEGTRRTLEFARRCGADRFLLTSSGAVYGAQPPEMSHVAEDYVGAPDCARAGSAYGEGKRLAELFCAVYAEKHGLNVTIARGFAFVGPYLPLDSHFAVGNFLRDGLRGEPIQIGGDGTPFRSYLYAADLAIWLWTILLRGRAGRTYNVGSEAALTIAQTAEAVAAHFSPAPPVRIGQPPTAGQAAARYVPSTARARIELGLEARVDLDEALRRTIIWNRANTRFEHQMQGKSVHD